MISPKFSVQSYYFLLFRESYFKIHSNFQKSAFKKEKKKRWRFKFSACSVIWVAGICHSSKTWFLTIPFTLQLKQFSFLQASHSLASEKRFHSSLLPLLHLDILVLKFNHLMAVLNRYVSPGESLA